MRHQLPHDLRIKGWRVGLMSTSLFKRLRFIRTPAYRSLQLMEESTTSKSGGWNKNKTTKLKPLSVRRWDAAEGSTRSLRQSSVENKYNRISRRVPDTSRVFTNALYFKASATPSLARLLLRFAGVDVGESHFRWVPHRERREDATLPPRWRLRRAETGLLLLWQHFSCGYVKNWVTRNPAPSLHSACSITRHAKPPWLSQISHDIKGDGASFQLSFTDTYTR